MQEYDQLKVLVEQAAEDIAKAEGGNKMAGTRVRKMMQEIRQTAQNIRIKILELRNAQTP
ncbi:MAG TPA: histone H1 [Phycisphaerae bacterium]|nr:histone H1 [Phycisphaerae bacterium]